MRSYKIYKDFNFPTNLAILIDHRCIAAKSTKAHRFDVWSDKVFSRRQSFCAI